MKWKRKMKDGFMKGLTWAAALISTLILGFILFFIFSRGLSGLSLSLLQNPYWSENLTLRYEAKGGVFEKPPSLQKEDHFVRRYGVALRETQDSFQIRQILVTWIDPSSPLREGIISTSGPRQGQTAALSEGSNLARVDFLSSEGQLVVLGSQNQATAKELAEAMEQWELRKLLFQRPGGGIRGSLIATLLLIFFSLLLALPIGISAAIFLREFAGEGFLSRWMRRSVETLAGVPSIIFGLMGVSVLFPITKRLGMDSVSILLGSMTMAVMLLPVIIRQTEESLKTVSIDLRDAALSLGATPSQAVFRILIPEALPGILSAVLLSVSRIIGESAALIYTMGTFVSDKPRLDQGATTLSVQIWSLMSGEQPNFQMACAISILILGMVLILNVSMKYVSGRLQKKWRRG